MAWIKVSEHPELGVATWHYNDGQVSHVEKVPLNVEPCTACNKNWVIPDKESYANLCIFCKSKPRKEDNPKKISFTL